MIRISNDEFKLIKKILKKHFPDTEVRAFGSRVNGDNREFSDLDLVIMSKERIDFRTMRKVKEDFEYSKLNLRVDLSDWSQLDQEFKEIINSNYEKF